MRKWIKTIVLLLLFAMAIAPVQALAAGESATAQIPFTVKKAPGTVVIEAVSEGAPMPDPARVENTSGGTFEITFTEPGNYFYKVYQQEGRDQVEFYDTIEYTVGVYVLYGKDGKLECTVVVSVDAEGETQKPDGIEFINPPPTTLAVTKTAKRDGQTVKEVFSGEEITYEITVTNIGRGTAYNVEVIDTLPIQKPELPVVTINDGGEKIQDGKAVRWKLDELLSGESATVSFTVLIPPIEAGVTWVNTVQVTYEDPADPSAPWPSAKAEITEGTPHAVIAKEQAQNGGARTKERLYVEPGDKITYYVTMTNDGSGSVLDTAITDEVPAGLSLAEDSVSPYGRVDNGVITWELGDLAAGESVTVSFAATVPDVTEWTVWINQALGEYTDGSKTEPQGLLRLLRAAGTTVKLETNAVEAVYEPPVSNNPVPSPSTPPSAHPSPSPSPTPSPSPGTSNSGDTPKTGDGSRPGQWLALLAISLLGLGSTAIVPRCKGKRSGLFITKYK